MKFEIDCSNYSSNPSAANLVIELEQIRFDSTFVRNHKQIATQAWNKVVTQLKTIDIDIKYFSIELDVNNQYGVDENLEKSYQADSPESFLSILQALALSKANLGMTRRDDKQKQKIVFIYKFNEDDYDRYNFTLVQKV